MIRDFDVELCLNTHLPAHHRNMQKIGAPIPKEYTDENWYWAISKVRIHSARNEAMTVPMPQTIDGRTNYEERRRYFEERKPAYQKAAWEEFVEILRSWHLAKAKEQEATTQPEKINTTS